MLLSCVAHYGVGKKSQADQLLYNALTWGNARQIALPFIEYGTLIKHLVKQLLKQRQFGELQNLNVISLLMAFYDNKNYAKLERKELTPESIGLLSSKELEVLKFLIQGLSNIEIADNLHVSVNTIKTHLKKIYEKLSVNNRTAAIAKAIELNIIESVVEE